LRVILKVLGVVSWGRLVSWLLGVDGGSLVGDIGNISVVSIRGVFHVLDSAVGKSNGVGSGNIAGTIGLLLGLEVGLGVVISHGVGEGVGGNLIGVFLSLVSGGWSISGGSLHNNGGVDGVVSYGVNSVVGDRVNGVVGNWVDSVVGNWMDGVMGNWVDGMVGDWVDGVMSNWVNGVVGNRSNSVVWNDSSLSYRDRPVGSNGWLDLSKTLGVVGLSHRGVGSSESLGLTESSHLTVSGGD